MSNKQNDRLTNWHILAQQRCSSQNGRKSFDSESDSKSSSSWFSGSARDGDSNLARCCNADIRRSTLMKRFWESSRSNVDPAFPVSFSEWQHGTSTRSKVGSSKSLLRESRKNNSGLHLSPQYNVQSQPSPSDLTYACFAMVPTTNEHSYVVYSSTENTAQTDPDTTDSYAMTTQSETTNDNSASPAMGAGVVRATKAFRINNNGISDVTNDADIPNLPIKYQFVINPPSKEEQRCEFVPRQPVVAHQINDTSRCEAGKTNLNVITNVQLSSSTLNLIFSQVMQDVLHTRTEDVQKLEGNIAKQKAYNFKYNIEDSSTTDKDDIDVQHDRNSTSEECTRADAIDVDTDQNFKRKFIGKINVGSPYRKQASPSVSRLSALPRTSSMEVNVSSNDSNDFDKDSDDSLVDSLDDPSSPRLKVTYQKNVHNIDVTEVISTRTFDNHKDKLLRRDDEVIEKKETRKTIEKSSVFYVPIDEWSLKSDSQQTVSDLFPRKLKERLLRRQLKREEKRLQERLKAFDVENGNATTYFSTSPEAMLSSNKKIPKNTVKPPKTKATLPTIDLNKDYRKTLRSNKFRDSVDSMSSTNKKAFMLPKTHQYANKQQSSQKQQKEKMKNSFSPPISTSKHIEILEIMEIVEPERALHLIPKTKSRIPVLQHHANTKLPKLRPKPMFLDFGEVGQPGDPKLDQLIANILIDTLNHEDIKDHNRNSNKENTFTFATTSMESKPTKKSKQVKGTMEQNNSGVLRVDHAAQILTKQVLDNQYLHDLDSSELVDNVEGIVMQDIHTNDMPKGWITLYMLQKAHTQSPDSTSDEGERTAKTAKTATRSTQYAKHDIIATGINRSGKLESGEADSDITPPSIHNQLKQRSKLQGFSNKQDEWHLTFSNSGSKQSPEVEMKFKFPTLERISSTRILGPTNTSRKNTGLIFDDVCRNESQSEIHKSKQYLKNPININIPNRRITLSPRATKTSRQRTILHHRLHVHCPRRSSYQCETSSPGLTISGSTLAQISRLPQLSAQMLRHLISKLQSQQNTTAFEEPNQQ